MQERFSQFWCASVCQPAEEVAAAEMTKIVVATQSLRLLPTRTPMRMEILLTTFPSNTRILGPRRLTLILGV